MGSVLQLPGLVQPALSLAQQDWEAGLVVRVGGLCWLPAPVSGGVPVIRDNEAIMCPCHVMQ